MQNNQFKHRIVKIELQNGQWKRYFNINNDKFKRLYGRYKPKNCYMSVSTWLSNPENNSFNKIILDSEILLDFDYVSKENVLEAIECMEKSHKEYYLSETIKTSIMGLHLIYRLKNKPTISDPKERLQFYINEKTKIANTLKNCKIDFPVLIDIDRIRRIKGTQNGNKDCFCYECSLTSGIVGENKYKTKREIERSPLVYTYKFVSNKIDKDKYYIHIKLNSKLGMSKTINDLIKFYSIKPYITIIQNKNIEIISNKIVSYNRLLKILRYCNASNLKTFEKYKQSWIRISSLLKINENEIMEVYPKPEVYNEMLENKVKVAIKVKR